MNGFIIFSILVFFSTIFYALANFYNKMPGVSNSFWKVFGISLVFVIIEYCFRLPAIFYFGKNMSSVLIYTIVQGFTFFTIILFSKFVLKEDVKPITYGLVIIIMSLIFGHNIIIKNGEH